VISNARPDTGSGVGAVIAAAGRSQRMGETDKLRAPLGKGTVLGRVVDVFQKSQLVDCIVIVLAESNLDWGRALVMERGWSKVTDVCAGGRRRQDSVAAGLSRLGSCSWVIVHDGARPLVSEDLISRGLEAAVETGAAVAAVAAGDTIKLAEGGYVYQSLPREKLWVVQTPQVFLFDLLSRAYRESNDDDVTDDASLVERLGYPVKLYEGSYDNIKITTPDDLAVAGVLVEKYEG